MLNKRIVENRISSISSHDDYDIYTAHIIKDAKIKLSLFHQERLLYYTR